MSSLHLRHISLVLLASCAATYTSAAAPGDSAPTAPATRCGPGGPPGAKCGPPAAGPPPAPAPPPPTVELVHPSVHTVVSSTINGATVRAVAGRGARGAFVTLETLDRGAVASRTPIAFDGVGDVTKLDVIQLMWRTDRPGALVFHLGANIGGWICHLDSADATARCVVARGGGRPSK